jgi:DNA-directed RNA polymerase specialized sigma24 family protein
MSDHVGWIAAQEGERNPPEKAPLQGRPVIDEDSREDSCKPSTGQDTWKKLSAHTFQKQCGKGAVRSDRESDWNRDPDLWVYRTKTTGLLRRYMRWSLAAGRLPSLLGRELFRAKISAFTATTFEARVIFLHDVERCLDRLYPFDRQIIGRIILQEYDHHAAARILRCDRKTIERRLPELIDELSEAFLKAGLLERAPQTNVETL